MGGNGNGRILQPGRIQIDAVFHEAPLAQPVGVTLNTPDGPRVQIIGGLSKLEHVAALIEASTPDVAPNGTSREDRQARIMQRAESILLACAAREQPPQEEPTSNP